MKYLALSLSLSIVACAEPGGGDDGHEETEIITTVTLTFTPEGSSMPIAARFRDPDGDGGMSGTTDPLALLAGTTYTMRIEFLDELGTPVEDITREIEEEAEAHQIFVFGEGIAGPAAGDDPSAVAVHAYADVESDYGENTGDDLPVGIAGTLTTRAAGEGELTIALRHMPELNGQAQKVAGLAESFAAGEPLPGEIDANVTFDLTVVQ